MHRNLERSAFLATIGAAILAIVALQQMLEHFWSLPRSYRWAAIIGIGIIAAALVLIILWWIERVRDRATNLNFTAYQVSRVEESEIDDFHAFCESLLGQGVASKERMHQWRAKNSGTLYLVFSEDRRHLQRRRKIVGFFSIFPVTKEASDELARNQLKGTELGSQYIVAEGRKPAAIYIGGVGAKGFRAKQQTFGALVGQVTLLRKNTPLIFTRPITKVGRIRALEYGFSPVIHGAEELEDMVYILDTQEQRKL